MTTTDARPNIVFIVAHPDDVAFAMGGTAWLLKDDYRLHIFCATRGDRGYPGAAEFGPSAEVAATRSAEELAAAALLDAQVTFLGQLDGEIFADRAACTRVSGLLSALRPRAVFTHDPFDKADHAATAQLAVQSLEMAKLFWETEIYSAVWPCGGCRRSDLIDIFVNISEVMEPKRALIRCHQSHLHDESDVEQLLAPHALLGRLAWCDYAEAYRAYLPLIARRWQRPAGSILMELTSAPLNQEPDSQVVRPV